MKRIISILLCLVMVGLAVPCLSVAADTAATPISQLDEAATVSAGGVYSISTVAELQKFAALCTEANDYFEGATVILTENITMNSGWTASDSAPTGNGAVIWTPIAMFKGVFDGQGNTISGIYAKVEGSSDACGLFAEIANDSATIDSDGKVASGYLTAVQNLNIDNSYFYSPFRVAAVCGSVPDSCNNHGIEFKNINVTNTMIVGSGSTETGPATGGIVAAVHSADRTGTSHDNKPVYFYNCSFGGSVTGNAVAVGGIVGRAYIKLKLENCVNNGTVESESTGTKSANAAAGGIVGSYTNGANKPLLLIGCDNMGSVFTETTTKYAELGGIIGYANRPVSISDCSNSGDVYSTSTESYALIGGMIGNATQKIEINGCINSGDLYTTAAKTYTRIGGMIGYYCNANEKLTGVINDCVNVGEISRKRSEAILDVKFSDKNYLGGIMGYSEETIAINRCANFGKLYVQAATTEDNCGAVTTGGILGGSTVSGMTLTDCVFTGEIDAAACSAGGIVGLFNQADGALTRCVCIGIISASHANYRGSLVGNINNSTDITFEDCVYNSATSAVPKWVGFKAVTEDPDGTADTGDEKTYRYIKFTIKTAGKDDIVSEYKYDDTAADKKTGINPTKISNLIIATGAEKSISSLTDPDVMSTLTAFDWENESGGWALVQVGEIYLPMPKTVSKIVDPADIPALSENKTQDGNESGDGEDQDTTIQVPDGFDPSLIIGSNKNNADTEDTSEATDTNEPESEESTDTSAENGGCGSSLTCGSAVIVISLLCIAAVILKKRRNATNA